MNEIMVKKKSGLKNIIMFLVSIALGAAGVFFSKQFIDEKISFYRSQMEVTDELIKVVVPMRNLMRGEVVTADVLLERSVPKKYTDINALKSHNYQIAIGQRLSFDAEEGKPLLWAHLEGGVQPTFSGKLEDGLRALTVPVDDINSISGFLQPNDTIDLLLTYSGGNREGKITFPLIQGLHVMATGVKTGVDKTGRASRTRFNTITVQVSPSDAKKITLAQEMGKITATLRHPDDSIPLSSKPLTVADLLGKPKVLPKKAKRKIVIKKKKPKKGVEYIIGGI